ncbi:MAG: hypothetical protein KDE33_23570 [Bacteroidetes bacterium]|nr:hypothetical protein [Bacteroidota bacterium]
MKYQEISHWSNVDNLQGLLFFAQKVDELLFDYTMDTYKPMALNARLLCIEALETIDYVRKDVLNDQNIDHIINELKWSLRRDTSARSLLGDNIERYEDALKPGVVSNEYLISTIELLYNHFNEKKYLDEINKLIIDSILNNGKEKEKFEILISSLITELINYGYSRRHIYYQNSQFFFIGIGA